jgi:beta-mannanase
MHSRARRALGTALLLLTVALTTVTTAGPTVAKPTAQPTAPAASNSRTFGLALPGVPDDLTELREATAQLGSAPDTVTWYVAWSTRGDFPTTGAAAVAAAGAVPEITWEPWDPASGTDQPAYRLRTIASGAFDGYLARWARQIRSYGKPVVLRFAHEANGSWYPWAEQVNGNEPGDYVAAWRHVWKVFQANRATNVVWRWSPNVPYPGSTELRSLYPGDGYVSQVALDGYNWAGLQPGTTWTSFGDLFGPGLTELRNLTGKPLYVGEVGCPEVGGDKAAWARDMFAYLAAHPEIRGVTWFDYLKEADWRVDSSPATLEAFRSGLATFG